jgi:hypothetical protein
LTRWLLAALAWQVAVLLAVAAYAVPVLTGGARSYAWAAPALGAVLGTALPLQLAAIRIARSL